MPTRGRIRRRGRIGSKGEIYAPKLIRDNMGLKPGDEIIISVREGKEMQIRRIPTLEELLEQEPLVTTTLEELEKDLENIQAEQMELSLQDHENHQREDENE